MRLTAAVRYVCQFFLYKVKHIIIYKINLYKDMKTLRNTILEAVTSTDFPAKNAWRKKDGIISIKWNCGNDTAKEYLRSAIGSYDTTVALWFYRYNDRINNISMSIYDDRRGVIAYIYFSIDKIGGRAIRFEGKFDSIKEAKTKMYELLCKMRDDIDILRKMKRILDPDPDKFRYLTFDEMINL